MRKTIRAIAVMIMLTVMAFAQSQAPPTGYVGPYALAAMGPSGLFAYGRIDASGNIYAGGTGTPGLMQLSGYVGPYAPVAQDPNGNWQYLKVDSSGNLLINGTTGFGNTSPTGQLLYANYGGNPGFASPGITDANGNATVSSVSYTPKCDDLVTNHKLQDRGLLVRLVAGNTGLVLPDSTASGCPGMYFRVTDESAGASVVTLTNGSDRINILNGNSSSLAQTTFSLATGQYVTFYQNNTNLWTATVSSNSSNNTALNNIQNASGNGTLTNGNNQITWGWQLTTNSIAGLTIQESAVGTGTSTELVHIVSANANSPTSELIIDQAAISNTTAIPALVVNCAWNNAALVGSCAKITVNNTTSNANSIVFGVYGGTGSTLGVGVTPGGNLAVLGNVQSTGSTTPTTLAGGIATTSAASAVGAAIVFGSDNSSNNAAAAGGLVGLRAGFLSNATPNAAAIWGAAQLGTGFFKGAAIANVGDIVCATAVAFTATDCSHTGPAVNILGIALSTTVPILVINNGQSVVKTDGAVTLGDILCMGVTTDGLAHDNGTAACATAGTTIGVVTAVAGSVTLLTNTNGGTAVQTLSTTLPLVQLHIGK